MSQHTPGPWRVGASGVTVFGGKILKGAWSFRVPYPSGNNNKSVAEAEANARLIAKAPEMYEFLCHYADKSKTSKSLSKMAKARALLRKIEGDLTGG